MSEISLMYPALFRAEWLNILQHVFSDRWIGQGDMVDAFENEFGNHFGFTHCVAVNSGTSALELAYEIIGIGSGDEVITPVLTCSATNIPLLRRGANVVFADIDDDLTISYEDVRRKISSKTKALVVVSLGGLAVNPDIYRLAEQYNVPVVVDAAQSLGVIELNGDYIAYSFQAVKHFTTGDGGMLVVRERDDYVRAKQLRWFGIDRDTKRQNGWRSFSPDGELLADIHEPGFKWQMTNIQAAMGLVGLKHSDELLRHRQCLAACYEKMLHPVHVLFGGSCWLLGVFVKDRLALISHLLEHGIESDIVHFRNDILSIFGGKRRDLPNMNRLENHYLYLPLHPGLTERDVKTVGIAIEKYYFQHERDDQSYISAL